MTWTALTQGGSTTDGTSFTTASVSPAANARADPARAYRSGSTSTNLVGNLPSGTTTGADLNLME